MNIANPMQNIQDWLTQQWVIFRGQKIDPNHFQWLMGPFGNLNGIGEDVIHQLAEKENLIIQRDVKSHGLIESIDQFNLSETDRLQLAKTVIHFYEKTSEYRLDLTVQWNPFFKLSGILVNKLFSHRIKQLSIPIENDNNLQSLKSEIITLVDPKTNTIKYTVWLRTSPKNNRVMYSGIYGTCTLPSGKTCVKAIFPLPHGNATVIMKPSVGENGELILDSSGQRLGDAGFYFLLKDAKGQHWAQFISSFRDQLVVSQKQDHLVAEQILTLWRKKVLRINYRIQKKVSSS